MCKIQNLLERGAQKRRKKEGEGSEVESRELDWKVLHTTRSACASKYFSLTASQEKKNFAPFFFFFFFDMYTWARYRAEQTFCFANHFRLNAERKALIARLGHCILITLFWQPVRYSENTRTMTHRFVLLIKEIGNLFVLPIICPTNLMQG